jgi:hypothetical protein
MSVSYLLVKPGKALTQAGMMAAGLEILKVAMLKTGTAHIVR